MVAYSACSRSDLPLAGLLGLSVGHGSVDARNSVKSTSECYIPMQVFMCTSCGGLLCVKRYRLQHSVCMSAAHAVVLVSRQAIHEPTVLFSCKLLP